VVGWTKDVALPADGEFNVGACGITDCASGAVLLACVELARTSPRSCCILRISVT
jgi:hypothetical protein